MKKIYFIISLCAISFILSGCGKNSAGSGSSVTDVTTEVSQTDADISQNNIKKLMDEIRDIKSPYYDKKQHVKEEYQEKVKKEIRDKLQEYVDNGLIKGYSESQNENDSCITGNKGEQCMCYYFYDESVLD